MTNEEIERIVELGLLCATGPCSERKLASLFTDSENVTAKQISTALESIATRWQERAVEVKKSAGGWQIHSKNEYKERLQKFLEANPPRLSRPLYEVLAIVAYHQPVTRGTIEEIRGVTTSAGQISQLEELGWIEVTDKLETPGRPLVYSTTTKFLDDLGIKSIQDLPSLDEFAEELEAAEAEGPADVEPTQN